MLDLQSILKIGQLVHLELADNSNIFSRYPSRVENVNANELTLASPMKNRMPLYVASGTQVSVWFWDNVAIYTFNTIIIRNINEKIPQLVLKGPEKLERVQNREYVRVYSNLDVVLKFINENDEIQETQCRTRDISGGGLMLVLSKPIRLKKHVEVSIKFELTEEEVEAKGVIVWNDWELDRDGIERNIVGVKFTSINEKSRQQIVKYVYSKQIELRRKGLI